MILFCSLITQSSLTMTLMLMRRWRGCFNELHSTSEELRRVRESDWVAPNIKTHLVLQLACFTGRDLSGTRLMREWNKEILNCTIKKYSIKSSWSFVKKWGGGCTGGNILTIKGFCVTAGDTSKLSSFSSSLGKKRGHKIISRAVDDFRGFTCKEAHII